MDRHDFENSNSPDDYGHCLVCRIRGFFVSGEWFHEQHIEADKQAKLRHPSNPTFPSE